MFFFAFQFLQDILSSNGFVVTYNCCDRTSFECLRRIRGYILRVRAPLGEERIPFVLVANFSDKKDKAKMVPSIDGKELAISFECPFFETSATSKDPKQTQEAFSEVIRDIYLIQKAKEEGQKRIPLTPMVKEAKQSYQFRYSRVDTDEIKFSSKTEDEQPQIRAASFEKLVERLTYEKYSDPNLVLCFLLTYRQRKPKEKMKKEKIF
jgi:GTPase SAR1 family protein